MSPSQQNRLRALFGRVEAVDLAYLFGSHARGEIGPMSDVDLAVRVDPEQEIDELALQARLAHGAARHLDEEEVDLTLLRRAPVELAYHVIAQGTLLYRRNRAVQVGYEAYILGRYGDYLPVLQAQRQQLISDTSHVARIQRYRTALRRTERTLGALTDP